MRTSRFRGHQHGCRGLVSFPDNQTRPYPGRTPHIHARVVSQDGRELVTQIYLGDHPLNRKDWIFRSLGAKAQSAAIIDPEPRDDGDLKAEFDFVV